MNPSSPDPKPEAMPQMQPLPPLTPPTPVVPIEPSVSAPAPMTIDIEPQAAPIEHGSNTIKITGAIVAVLCLLALGGYFGYIQPRMISSEYAKKALTYVPSLRANLQNASSSIENMYKLTSNQVEQKADTQKSLLRLNVQKFTAEIKRLQPPQIGEVAGVSTTMTSAFTQPQNVIDQLKKTAQEVQQSGSFKEGGNVRGESTQIESKHTQLLRQLKEESTNAGTNSKKAEDAIGNLNLLTQTYKNSNGDIAKQNEELSKQNTKASEYLAEVSKTSTYYSQMSDIQIRLDPLLVSYINIVTDIAHGVPTPEMYNAQLEDMKQTLDKMNAQLRDYDEASLPNGLSELHEDNKKVIKLLDDNVTDIASAIKANSYKAFATAIVTLDQQLNPLAQRAITLEQSFWQNDTLLRSQKDILDGYAAQEKALKEMQTKNKLPFT